MSPDETPTHLDLFSGIGGFAIAAAWAGFRTVAFCEISRYRQKAVQKHWPGVPVYRDIRTFVGDRYRGVHLLTGGFPCQPYSLAGQRRGKKDHRYIWPQMRRVIAEAAPAYVLAENVPGIVQLELDNVLSDLETLGYATWPLIIPACAVDAKHRRDRVWVIAALAHAAASGLQHDSQVSTGRELAGRHTVGSRSSPLAHASGTRLPASQQEELPGPWRWQQGGAAAECCWWSPEPEVGRVAYGIPGRVDRLKGLGDAIVPQVAYELLREIRKTL